MKISEMSLEITKELHILVGIRDPKSANPWA